MIDLLVDLEPGMRYDLEVWDLTGRIVHQENGLSSGVKELNLNALSGGTYLFRIRSEKGTLTRKYTKQ